MDKQRRQQEQDIWQERILQVEHRVHFGNLKETFKEGAYGLEAYNNMKFDKEFYASDGYRMMSEDSALVSMYGGQEGLQLATQMFLDNKITDATVIREALQNGITGDEYSAYKKSGIDDIKRITKIKKNSRRFSGLSPSQIASRAVIADKCKEKGITSKNDFINFVRLYGGLGLKTKKEYEDFYNQIKYLY